MLDSYSLIGIMAGAISFCAYVFYIVNTLKGKTKPNRATWWILTLIGIMIAWSYYVEGARDTIWIALSYVVGPLVIAILSLQYGEGEWETLDKACLTGAISSAVVWSISESALVVLIINVCMDFIGLIPTIKKSYLRPEGEDRTAWTMEVIAGFLNLFAIKNWIFGIAFYPLYLVIINSVVLYMLYRPILKHKVITS